MDRWALRDALFAEKLSGGLRGKDAFRKAQILTSDADLDAYARNRSEAIRQSLSGSVADSEWAMEHLRQVWRSGPPPPPTTRVVSVLVSQCDRLLRADGADIVLNVDREEPGREILRWRFVSLALPPSILIAAVGREGVIPPPDVRLLHRAMAPDGPVAHQHVHHAAMGSFEELWAMLRLRALLETGRFWDGFREPRAFCPGLHDGCCIGGRRKEERDLAKKYSIALRKHLFEWGAVIRLAFVGRGVLVRHLKHDGVLAQCRECAAGRRAVRPLLAGTGVSFSEMAIAYPWPDELVGLRRRQQQYEGVFEKGARLSPGSVFAARLAASERILVAGAFKRVAPLATKSADEIYEKLLLQYLRVKSALYGLLVHPPGEHGLENFLDHFLQIKVYAPDADIVVPRRPEEPGLVVGATEYRVAPDAWFKVRRRAEIERAERTRAGFRPETGWLIHFKRRAADKALPLHSTAVRSMDADADVIARYLDADPTQLRSLRGIDICGVEESQPCWVVADTLRRLRRRSEEIVARNGHRKLQPLRLTLHSGEDFEWLTSGVRAIAEPFVWQLFQRGDRIGHGIAVTLEPRKWWSRKSRDVIGVKRFDRLLDLAFLADYVTDRGRDQQEWLTQSITKLVLDLQLEFPRPASRSAMLGIDFVDTAKKLWRCLGMPVTRRLMATPDFVPNDDARHHQWLHRYLWNRRVQELAVETLPMRLEDDRDGLSIEGDRNERDLLVEARSKVIQQLARWQICIESNPSSNLVVGSLDSLLAQDFLHRRPTSPAEQTGDETLLWTISTDDPITFATTLANEYAYAWAGMILRKDKPFDPAYARALLDEAAATSMRTRFTIPADDDDHERDRRRNHSRTRRD